MLKIFFEKMLQKNLTFSVNSISDKDVSDFYNTYGWYWN